MKLPDVPTGPVTSFNLRRFADDLRIWSKHQCTTVAVRQRHTLTLFARGLIPEHEITIFSDWRKALGDK